jgi:HD superfamily phosphodiesterase
MDYFISVERDPTLSPAFSDEVFRATLANLPAPPTKIASKAMFEGVGIGDGKDLQAHMQEAFEKLEHNGDTAERVVLQHTRRVSVLSGDILRAVQLNNYTDYAYVAGYFHDFGKLDVFAHKPALMEENRLYSDEERALMDEHTRFGAEKIANLSGRVNAVLQLGANMEGFTGSDEEQMLTRIRGLYDVAAYVAFVHHAYKRKPVEDTSVEESAADLLQEPLRSTYKRRALAALNNKELILNAITVSVVYADLIDATGGSRLYTKQSGAPPIRNVDRTGFYGVAEAFTDIRQWLDNYVGTADETIDERAKEDFISPTNLATVGLANLMISLSYGAELFLSRYYPAVD